MHHCCFTKVGFNLVSRLFDLSLLLLILVISLMTMMFVQPGERLQTREHLALEVLKHWQDMPGGRVLVPEHIETRALFCNERPGAEQACWMISYWNIFRLFVLLSSFNTYVK